MRLGRCSPGREEERRDLPGLREPVTLWTPALGTLAASIDTVDGGVLTLALIVGLGPRHGLARPRTATLTLATRKGLRQLEGRASAIDDGVVRFEVDREEVVQRRENLRVDSHEPISLDRLGTRAPLIMTKTHDLSAGGCLVPDSEDLLYVGAPLRVALWLPDDPVAVKLEATVVRRVDGGLKGIRFDRTERRDEKRLVLHITRHQRSAQRSRSDG